MLSTTPKNEIYNLQPSSPPPLSKYFTHSAKQDSWLLILFAFMLVGFGSGGAFTSVLGHGLKTLSKNPGNISLHLSIYINIGVSFPNLLSLYPLFLFSHLKLNEKNNFRFCCFLNWWWNESFYGFCDCVISQFVFPFFNAPPLIIVFILPSFLTQFFHQFCMLLPVMEHVMRLFGETN